MQYYQMSNEDMNSTMTLAMNATIFSLTNEGLLTKEKGEEYKNTHICLKIDNRTIWDRIRAKFGFKFECDDTYSAVIVKVPSEPETTIKL